MCVNRSYKTLGCKLFSFQQPHFVSSVVFSDNIYLAKHLIEIIVNI